MNKKQILGLLNYLYADLDNKKISNEKLMVWLDQFSDVPVELARKTAKYMYSTQKIYGVPKVSDFQLALDTVQAKLSGKATPAEAFGLVLKAVRRFGYYQQEKAIASLPRQIALTVKCIGWKEICTTTEIGVLRAQFERAYSQLSESSKAKQIISQIENSLDKKLIEGN